MENNYRKEEISNQIDKKFLQIIKYKSSYIIENLKGYVECAFDAGFITKSEFLFLGECIRHLIKELKILKG